MFCELHVITKQMPCELCVVIEWMSCELYIVMRWISYEPCVVTRWCLVNYVCEQLNALWSIFCNIVELPICSCNRVDVLWPVCYNKMIVFCGKVHNLWVVLMNVVGPMSQLFPSNVCFPLPCSISKWKSHILMNIVQFIYITNFATS